MAGEVCRYLGITKKWSSPAQTEPQAKLQTGAVCSCLTWWDLLLGMWGTTTAWALASCMMPDVLCVTPVNRVNHFPVRQHLKALKSDEKLL